MKSKIMERSFISRKQELFEEVETDKLSVNQLVKKLQETSLNQ